jgi:type I restriction enzyme S subunit
MFEAESTVGYKLVEPGDLVINTMWAWMGAAGVAREHGLVSPAYAVYRLDSRVVLPEFMDLVVRSPEYVQEMTRFSRGVTSSRLRLYPDEFLGLRTTVPPIEAQRKIIDDLARTSEAVSRIVALLERQILLTNERRETLLVSQVSTRMPFEANA